MLLSRLVLFLALSTLPAFAPVKAWAVTDSKASVEEVVHDGLSSPPSAEGVEPQAGQEHDASTAGESHESGGLPQLKVETYPSQIFWLLVMFFVLYFSFSRKILPGIGAVVNAREDIIRGNLETAQMMREQAEEIQKAYEKSLEQARLQASEVIMGEEFVAKKKANDQMESFRRKTDSEVKSAEERVVTAKDKAIGEMSSIAAEVASVAAEKITGIGTDMQKARAIVDSIAGKAKAA